MLAAGIFWAWQAFHVDRRSAATLAAGAWQEVPVRRGPISETISALGTIVPGTQVDVLAQTAGIIRRVAVQEGDEVRPGQLLVQLDSQDAEVQVKQAQASLLSAQANLAKLLAGTSDADLAQAEASLEQAQASWRSASDQLKQDEALFKAGAVSQQELARSQDQLSTASRQLQAAQEKLAELKKGPTPEDLRAARAQVAQAEANLAAAQRNLAQTKVVAPIAGTVTSLSAQAGASVKSGDVLAVIADLGRMEAQVPINEIDAPNVRAGQAVSLTLDALPGRTFRGQVSSLAYQSSVQDNIVTYLAKIQVDNQDRALRPGMTVDASIILNTHPDALLVPVEALEETATGRTFVWVPAGSASANQRGQAGPGATGFGGASRRTSSGAAPFGSRQQARATNAGAVPAAGGAGTPAEGAVRVPVQVGLRNDTLAEITGGLREGDVVLIRWAAPQFQAQSAAALGSQRGGSFGGVFFPRVGGLGGGYGRGGFGGAGSANGGGPGGAGGGRGAAAGNGGR